MESFDIHTTDKDGKEILLVVSEPQPEDIEEAKLAYSNKFGELISQKGKKFLTRVNLAKYLETNGIWGKEDEDKIEELEKEIADLKEKIEHGGGKSILELRKLAIDMYKKRNEVINVRSKRRMYDDQTVESIAEKDYLDCLVHRCTKNAETGELYWLTFEDLKEDRSDAPSSVYYQANNKIFEYIYNVDTDFVSKYPETRWLKKYGFLNEELKFVNRKTNEIVDESYNPLSNSGANNSANRNKLVDLYGDLSDPEEPYLDEDGQPIELHTGEEDQESDLSPEDN